MLIFILSVYGCCWTYRVRWDAHGFPGLGKTDELLFVGITRAQATLTLTVPQQIKRGGELVDVPPSRFLQELPEADVDWPDAAADAAEQQAQRQKQIEALRARFGARSAQNAESD